MTRLNNRLATALAALLGMLALTLSGCNEPAGEKAATGTTAPAVSRPADWAAKYDFPEPASVEAMGCDGNIVIVRDLLDPDNPFRDRYLEFDYWCYANAKPLESDLLRQRPDELPEHYQEMNVVVDCDGFIVPQLEVYRMNIIRRHLPGGEEFHNVEIPGLDLARILIHGDQCVRSFKAIGTLDPEISSAFEHEVCKVLADYIPAVPGWLAAAPPRLVLLMNDGEIVTYGELGSNRGELLALQDTTENPGAPWLRFSAAGEELARCDAGCDWYELYFDGYDKLAAETGETGMQIAESSGMIVVFDRGAGTIDTIYDYHGTRLEMSNDELWAAQPPYEEVPGKFMLWLHEAQRNSAGGG